MSVANSRQLAEFADRCALPGLLRLHVVAEQDVLVAEVEFAAGDDRVGPCFLVTAVGLLEAAICGSHRDMHRRHGKTARRALRLWAAATVRLDRPAPDRLPRHRGIATTINRNR